MSIFRKALVVGVVSFFAMALASLAQQPTPFAQVSLRVSVNGQILSEGEVVALQRGKSVQLKVEVVRANGTLSDVTNSPYTVFGNISPWNLTVSNTGLVTATGDTGFSAQT